MAPSLFVLLAISVVIPSATACFPLCNASNASYSEGKVGCASEVWRLKAITTTGSDSGPDLQINEGAGCSYTWNFCDGSLQIAPDYYAHSPTFFKGASTSRSIQVWWKTWAVRREDTACDQPQPSRWKNSTWATYQTLAEVGTTLLICDSPGGRLRRTDQTTVAYCNAEQVRQVVR